MNEETMTIVEENRSNVNFWLFVKSQIDFIDCSFTSWNGTEPKKRTQSLTCNWQTRKMNDGKSSKESLFLCSLHSFEMWRFQHSSHHRPVSPIHQPRVLTMSNNPAIPKCKITNLCLGAYLPRRADLIDTNRNHIPIPDCTLRKNCTSSSPPSAGSNTKKIIKTNK